MTIGWLGKSMFAALAVIPFILTLNAFNRAYGVRPEPMMIYWFIGVVTGMMLYTMIGSGTYSIVPDIRLLALMLFGIMFGAVANILLVQAVVESPNPGLPMTIVGANSAMIFLIGPVLAYFLPRYFAQIKFDGWHFFGIILVVVGLGIITVHK